MHAAGIDGVFEHVWRRAHCSENRLREVVPNIQEFRIDFDITNEIKLLFYRLLWIRLLKTQYNLLRDVILHCHDNC